jgi:hypothetical protein
MRWFECAKGLTNIDLYDIVPTMSEKQKTARAKVLPSATPSESDIADWEAMTREEQLSALREVVDGPEARTDSGMSMDELLARARARSLAKSHV